MEFAGNQGNHQNFDLSLLPKKLWPIFMGMKQIFFFFWKKKSKMADSKKLSFSKSSILKKNLWKFCFRIGDFEKLGFFSRPFWIFLIKKRKQIASSPWKLVKVFWVSRMDQNFDDYLGFQTKITPLKHFSRQCKGIYCLKICKIEK